MALSVYSLTWITLINLDLSYNETVLYFVFYASITGYNFVKYFGVAKFRHRQLANWLKWIQILSFICFILMCYYVVQLKLNTLFFIVCFALLTALYAIPFHPKQNNTLRSVGGLKVYVIALVWAGVTVFIPFINADYNINTDVVILAFQRFLYVLVLMIPFEIRDLKFDNDKLSTIPQKLGVKKSKGLGLLLLLVFFLLEFLKDETTINYIIVLFIISVITGLFVFFSSIEQNKYYSAFWVEGLPIVWLIVLLYFN
ncbi:MAG: hypothetical protein P8K68_03190 [Algibacter sp.]|uniref:hypothetical protein n=1 Tax=Algibacter sp. TaxID=1872428 RepID=UPI00260FFC74|nr:hypothetical protein [Algibacter sp.]MDG1728737.1 hypothetical protein [Algibacter sp.]MDG2177776.1 hypothetical protein [Algibacter sp.]